MKVLGKNTLATLWERINKLIDCKRPIVWLEGSGEFPFTTSGNNYAEQAMQYVTCDTSNEKLMAMLMNGVIPRFFMRIYDTSTAGYYYMVELTPFVGFHYDIHGNRIFDSLVLQHIKPYDVGLENVFVQWNQWHTWQGWLRIYDLSCGACDNSEPL